MNTRLHLRFHKGELSPSYAEIYAQPVNNGNVISWELFSKREVDEYINILLSKKPNKTVASIKYIKLFLACQKLYNEIVSYFQ